MPVHQRALTAAAATALLSLVVLAGPALAAELTPPADAAVWVGPFRTDLTGQVASDADLIVNFGVEDLDDPSTPDGPGEVEIYLDLSDVVGSVIVPGLSTDCSATSGTAVTCLVPLPASAPGDTVTVPVEAIQLRAVAGAPVGPAGTIQLTWALNGTMQASTASISVEVIAAQPPPPPPSPTPTSGPVVDPTTAGPPASAAPSPPTVVTPVPPKVIRPLPTPAKHAVVPPTTSSSPVPGITMTPNTSAVPFAGTGVTLDQGPPIAAEQPNAGGSSIWSSPALIISLVAAAIGLAIASTFAVVSMRRAGK